LAEGIGWRNRWQPESRRTSPEVEVEVGSRGRVPMVTTRGGFDEGQEGLIWGPVELGDECLMRRVAQRSLCSVLYGIYGGKDWATSLMLGAGPYQRTSPARRGWR
jgi:hypothetical protein